MHILRSFGLLAITSACIPPPASRSDVSTAPSQPAAAPVDPEQAAWAQKQAGFDQMFAAELAAYRELEPRLKATGADAKLVAEADGLRARFVKRCVEESQFSTVACWNGTFARDITEALAKRRLEVGDKVGAYLEGNTLYEYPDLRGSEALMRAARDGVDDYPANIAAPEALKPLEQQMDFTAETVRKVVRSKSTAVIQFEARDSSRVDYSCGDDQVVVVADRSTPSGKALAVKRTCRQSGREDTHQTFASVTVPIDEVEGLKAGQRASVVYLAKNKRVGHLLDVWPDIYTKEYIRFRTTRMKKAGAGDP